jgi:hypothetical protein
MDCSARFLAGVGGGGRASPQPVSGLAGRHPKGVAAAAGQLVPAVRLSYRDVEELLAERGIEVDQRLRGRTDRGTTERGSRLSVRLVVRLVVGGPYARSRTQARRAAETG